MPGVHAGFRKGRYTRDHIVNLHWLPEHMRQFQEKISLCSTDYSKAFDFVDHEKL